MHGKARHLLLLLPAAALGLLMFGELVCDLLPERAPAPAADAEDVPRMVVLVFDGVDERIARQYLDAGELPNLAALANDGAFQSLRSELPPESPTALASLLTGVNPGRHRIFDFVKRGADDQPQNGMVEVKRGRFLLGRIPVRKPRVRSRLAAPTFTDHVWQAGYSVLSLRQPMLFPAPGRPGAERTSGLGTPDLAGAAGFYTVYSNRLRFESGYTIYGGLRVPLEGGAGTSVFDTRLYGPQDPTLGPAPDGSRLRASVPLRLELASEDGVPGVRITLGGRTEFVPHWERSGYLPVTFELRTLPFAREVKGIVRFEVLRLDPLEVMADPVQIDPRAAIFPVAGPPAFGRRLWNAYGPYETMGWQEQTFALNDRFQTDAGFLRDLLEDMDCGAASLLGEMRRVRPGRVKPPRLVFGMFTATDRALHCFYRYRDQGHPEHDPDAPLAGSDPILTVFRKMDDIVGKVRAQLGPEDVLLVCSDHGFQTWRWEVHVNQWLVDEGYLALHDAAETKGLGPFFTGGRGPAVVDWSRTEAFALGLGQIYVNLAGRDARGIVPPAEKRRLMEELCAKLLALENPYLGDEDRRAEIPARPLTSVTILEDVWDFGEAGPPAHVPDLQLGFAKGYRISWQTALLGGMKARGDVFQKNRAPWSGDHCSTDPEHVPGVLFTNRPLLGAQGGRPYHVRDVAATVLAHFGLDLAPLHGESRPLPLLSLAGPR